MTIYFRDIDGNCVDIAFPSEDNYPVPRIGEHVLLYDRERDDTNCYRVDDVLYEYTKEANVVVIISRSQMRYDDIIKFFELPVKS